MFLYIIPVLVLGALVILLATVKILREYERAVVFTLGRFQRVRGSGLVLLMPFFQEMVRVDLRTQVIEIPSQDVISRDNVSMKVDAVLYFNVVDPERAIIHVQNYLPATNMLAQTTLRAVLDQHVCHSGPPRNPCRLCLDRRRQLRRAENEQISSGRAA